MKIDPKNKTETEDPSKGDLNTPKINEKNEPTRRIITSEKQAHSYAKKQYDNAKDTRLRTAGIVRNAYDGAPPFDAKYLMRVNQGWRNNFSTNYLGSVIDRTTPQIKDPVNKADLLFHCTLPSSIADGASKARKFNEKLTKFIRNWSQFKTFTGRVVQEVVIYGNAVVTKIGEGWKPKVWRYDQAFLPEGTGQHSTNVSAIVLREKMLLHDFVNIFAGADKAKYAEKAGFDIEGCKKISETAKGSQQKSSEHDNALERQDVKREESHSDQMDAGNTTVELFHVVARDYTGGVDLWSVSVDDGTLARSVQDIEKSMEDCIVLLTMQEGNEKFYGSKGLGRYLTNIHMAVERNRVLGLDLLQLSGMRIGKQKSKNVPSTQMKMLFPFLLVGDDIEISSEGFEFNYEAFESMDKKFTAIGDSIAGAFIPTDIDQSGSAHTKIEAAQNASRELAVREGVLGRFFDQFSFVLDLMKTGIFTKVNMREGYRAYEAKKKQQDKGLRVILRKAWDLISDFFKPEGATPEEEIAIGEEDCVTLIQELLESGLTIDEIALLAVSPANFNSEDEGVEKDNKTMAYLAANGANPYINQKKKTEMEAKIMLGEDRANQILIPDEDPNIEAIARRQQTIEFAEMMDGFSMDVADSDNHKLHRKALIPLMTPVIEQALAQPTPQLLQTAQLCIEHYGQHLMRDTLTPEQDRKGEEKIIETWIQQLEKAQQMMNEQQAEIQAQAQAAGVADPGLEGAPAPLGAEPALATGGDTRLDSISTAADIEKARMEQERKDRELSLKERQQDHKEAMDAAQLELSASAQIQQMAEKQRADETQKANEDLSKTMGGA